MIGALLTRLSIKRSYAAIRDKDIAAVMKPWAEDGVWEYPGHSTMAGRYEGKAAIRAFWERGFARLEKFDIRPVNVALSHPFAFGFSNTALVEWVIDETAYDGTHAHVEGVVVMKIRRGVVVHARDYVFDSTPVEAMFGVQEAVPAGS